MSGVEKITIFQYNDFHRKLEPTKDGRGGAAHLVGTLRQLKEENPDSLTINVGDMAGDNTVNCVDTYKPLAEICNRSHTDVVVAGNHEYEDSANNYKNIREGLIQRFDGEVVCANVRDKRTGALLEGTKPYTIHQLAGINVAVIGMVTRDLTSRVFPLAGAGLSVAPLEDTLKEMLAEVKQAGADVVVLAAHEGRRGVRQLCQEVEGPALALAAHDHVGTDGAEKIERENGSVTYLSEADPYGWGVRQIDLFVDKTSHQVVDVKVTNHAINENSPSDPETERMIRDSAPLEQAKMPDKRSRPKAESSFNSFAQLSQYIQEKDLQL